MSTWQSKWKSTNDKRHNRIYWWNVDTRYTSWFDPKDFTSEDEYLNKSSEFRQENNDNNLLPYDKDEMTYCCNCNTKLKSPIKCHVLRCPTCENLIVKLPSKENKKKRKLENEELKSFREDSKKVIDKLSDENKRLKEKVSELNDLLKKEKMINSSIKKSSLFETLNIMIDENLRKDGKPSKNSVKI